MTLGLASTAMKCSWEQGPFTREPSMPRGRGGPALCPRPGNQGEGARPIKKIGSEPGCLGLKAEMLPPSSVLKTVGPGTEAMIRHHLENRSDAVNGLRAARRMRELAHLHGDARFEEVCVYALSINITALRSVDSILRHSPDRRSVTMEREEPKPSHENIRGPHYFGDRT